MKSKVGYSVLEDSFSCGQEAAKNAAKELSPKLCMLFSSVVLNQGELIKGVKSSVGNIPIVGCTSSGAIIVPDGYIDNAKGYAGILAFDGDIKVGVAGREKGANAREVGAQIAEDALKNAGMDKAPDYFYMVANPGEEEMYLKGIEDVIGRVPFFGGSAADNTLEGKWQIFANDKIFSSGCAVAFFYAGNECKTEYTGAYEETDKVGVITKIDGRKLVEINNIPALEQYSKWSGKPIDKLLGGSLLVETILAPLGVKDPIGSVTAIRHPMNGNDDKSMNIGSNLSVNTAVTMMKGSPDGLIASTGNTLKNLKSAMSKTPAAFLLVHCGGRRLAVLDRMAEVHKSILKEAGDIPFIVIFTFGEYGYADHSANTCGGLMLSFTGFSK
ncbi:MAG: FIST C-terminal domain-containing protein [Elusimicrobiota bacterium]|jgi:hypothetical protein|nr:FIST C-terminal domain-containing protein [Elusimicrobiota bacterium]